MRINVSNDDLIKCGIYAIRSTANCKIYIGQTRKTFGKRLLEHKFDLNDKKRNDSRYLQNSYNKYGSDTFEAVIQEIAPDGLTKDELVNWLNERETFWIRYYRRVLGDKNVFNLNDGGDGHWASPETRKLLSDKGKAHYNAYPERRKRASEISKHSWSDPVSRAKRVDKNRQTNSKASVRKKNSESQKKRWEEQHEHLTEVNRKTHSNKEHGEFTSRMNKERWKDPEVKRKHAESTVLYWSNPESHKKRSEQMRKRMAKERIELRKQKRENEKFLDVILYVWYIHFPNDINLSPSGKFILINRIAKILSCV